MDKRLSLGIFLANWIVCLFLVCSLPSSADAAHSTYAKSKVQLSKSLFSESFNLSETSSHEISFEGFLPSQRSKFLFSNSRASVASIPFSEYTTVPFFDVKQTFIHFFHTW